jgi:SAM-dependent methyltransferase
MSLGLRPDTDTLCPVCGGPTVSRAVVEAEPPALVERDIRSCQDCRANFAHPLTVPDRFYEAIYENVRALPNYARYDRFAERIAGTSSGLDYLADQQDVYWGTQRLLDSIRSTHPRVVEIGSGLGYFTAALRKDGRDATGVDLSQAAVDAARARFGPYYHRADVFQPGDFTGTFDVAVAMEVVEHVEDPVGFLRAIGGWLRPGGRLIVTTPNRDAYPDDAVWRTDGPPVHLYWFSEESVRRLLDRAGFVDHRFVDFSERNARAHASISLNDLTAVPPSQLDGRLEPRAPLNARHRLVEGLEAFPAVGPRVRAMFYRFGRGRVALGRRSFSLVVGATVAPPDR